MPSYRSLIDVACNTLYESSDSPRIDSEVLLLHVIEKPLAWLIAYGDGQATVEHIDTFNTLIDRRLAGEPIAYIVGYKEFWSLNLVVNQHVLIPRSDTETLIEVALDRLSKDQPLNVLDLGTGSGAIALSIAKERPLSQVVGLEYQAKALQVAQENAKRNQLSNVAFHQSDWFSHLDPSARFDLIASNPPYVEPGDPHLQQGDLRFEPLTSLTAAGNGLADIKHIVATAPDFLNDGAALIIEHGHEQGDEVANLFEQRGFTNIQLHQDINDLPRCTIGQMHKT